jgi:hypothetical protein
MFYLPMRKQTFEQDWRSVRFGSQADLLGKFSSMSGSERKADTRPG